MPRLRQHGLILVTLTLLFVPASLAKAGEPNSARIPTADLVFDSQRGQAEFRIQGLDPASLAKLTAEAASTDRWTGLIPISVGPGKEEPVSRRVPPPILGSYRVEKKVLIFHPRYPLDRSIAGYVIQVDPSLWNSADRISQKKLRLVISTPPQSDSASEPRNSRVEAVYPSSGALPENTLKFYIAFSTPMSRGEAYKNLRLLDGSGKDVADPFLELGEELWSVDGKRFTLLFDPGRIKRGLKPREEVGPVLESGKRYTLVIAAGWPDARGNPLEKEYRKSFRVGPPDETVPDPRNWTIRAPHAGSLDPLVVRFPEPLDRALADRLIAVQTGKEARNLEGVVRVEAEETVWTFMPKQPWREGEHQLVVGTDLEDLAGNSVGRRFEVDLVEPITSKIDSSTVMIPFQIGR